jgi:hypothetical protein
VCFNTKYRLVLRYSALHILSWTMYSTAMLSCLRFSQTIPKRSPNRVVQMVYDGAVHFGLRPNCHKNIQRDAVLSIALLSLACGLFIFSSTIYKPHGYCELFSRKSYAMLQCIGTKNSLARTFTCKEKAFSKNYIFSKL